MCPCQQTGLSVTQEVGSSARSLDGYHFAFISPPVKWHEYIFQEYVNFLTFSKGLWAIAVALTAADSTAAFSR